VEGEWLAEMGPMFFTVKESYKTRLEQRQREQLEQASMEVQMADKISRKKEVDEAVRQKAIQASSSRRVAMSTPGLYNKQVDKDGKKTPKRTPFRVGL
jgi:pre-mRNA-splicing factor ATP-dependent RNA helicase DHX38/PRP16